MRQTIAILTLLAGSLAAQTQPATTPTAAPAKKPTIAQRKAEQQKRIAQGVASGELTPKETAHLENREANINREVRAERKANGGNLTNKEKKAVVRQQNRLSKSIYNQKHDVQTQPK